MKRPVSLPTWVKKTSVRRALRPAWWFMARGTEPASRAWGFDRGSPIDRLYVEQFLDRHRADIRGRVLEVKNSYYTDRFGTGVRQRDVLDIRADNPGATVVADLAAADAVPDDEFDCFVLTQTLQFISDPRSAIEHARRILRPGGVLLATIPAVSPLAPSEDMLTDYWRFTCAGSAELFGAVFGTQFVTVQAYGNYRTAVAFLAGLAWEELPQRSLHRHDERYPVLVTVRAVKDGDAGCR